MPVRVLLGTFIQRIQISISIHLLLALSSAACIRTNDSAAKTVPNDSPIESAEIAPVEQLGKAFTTIAAHVKPAVVSVFSEKTIKFRQEDLPFPFGDDLFNEFFGQRAPGPRRPGRSREYKIPETGMGSGMILDHQGNILTNYHVIQNVDEIKVLFPDQKIFKAKVIGKDARTDVAIIQVQGHGLEKYPIINWGDSDAIQVGDIVLAIGAPFGLAQTVTHGIISAKGRSDVGIADYEDFLQTDAPINPGNSGGPLVNARGEIIGMNSAIATSVGQSGGIGFAIPSNMIKAMLPKIIKGEAITRGELGVGIQTLTEDLAHHFGPKDVKGVLISQVRPGSAAEKAGVKDGDIIIRYDGKPVEDARVFRNLVAGTLPGSKVKIELLRNKKNQIVTATIGQQSEEPTEAFIGNKELHGILERLGLSVETLTKDLARRFHAKETSGVVISDIEDGGPASLAGLQVGDVIAQVNHKAVKNADEFTHILSRIKDNTVLMLVKRQGQSMFVSIQVD